MKRFIGVMALAVAMLGLTGCDDYVTPKGVVETAAVKVKLNDLKGFKKALGGEALKQYGNKAAMTALGEMLGKLAEVKASKAKRVAYKPVTDNGFQTALITYTVDVLGKTTLEAKATSLLTATVTCDIYELDSSPMGRPGNRADCRMQAPGPSMCDVMPNDTTEVSECRIIELK